MSQESQEVTALREFYAALSRNDIDATCAFLDPQIYRVEFEGAPNSGTYRGLEALREHIASGRSTWAEGACKPEVFHTTGDKILVDVHVHVRLHGNEKWIDGRVVDGFRFVNGKITEFHSFTTAEKAQAWAGTPTSATSSE
ncbi:MAG: nuclear transport factor 2 family protein [Bdellovibrionaceae bacterium]|mgnify:CR=1 FL=1|nr:nuclear transport factor 2 family protein [Pseudobdellovibrionaceae bacterium]